MFSQYCSSPALQLAQTRQESTMQPTAAMSPSLNFLTSRPTFTTRPTISWPGTHGYTVGITSLHSLRTWCKSEWQTPQKRISICTSCGRGDRRWIVCFASGDLGSWAANDFAGKIMGDGRAASLMASLLKNRNSRASWTDGRELCLTPRAGARLYESRLNLIAEVVDWGQKSHQNCVRSKARFSPPRYCSTSKIISSSTGTPSGRLATPYTKRHGFLSFPKTSCSNAEAPSAIFGCSRTSPEVATYTLNLTVRVTLSSDPKCFRATARPLSAARRAARCPASRSSSAPTRPTNLAPWPSVGIIPVRKSSLPVCTAST